jgi:peptidoglycan/LPS O-acetylase OafA/YrhL
LTSFSSENERVSLEQGNQRRADIQGLRAIAVLLVVAFHAGLPVPGGFSGVDVFFAISGFVITGTLLRELTSAGRIDLPRFYARRVRRLLPALALMVTVVAVLGSLASPLATQRTGALTGIASSVFAANVYLYQLPTGYFDVSATLDPLLHTWTLAVEEQFYLVFPALLIVGWAARRGRRLGAAAIVAAVSVVSYVLAVELAGGRAFGGLDSPESFGFYSSPTRAWEFGLGALVALAVPWVARMSARSAAIAGGAGLGAIALTAFAVRETSGDPRDVVLAVAGTCAVLLAGTAGRGPVTRLLGTAPAVWIGNLSYSWYLWHWPLIVFARALWPEARAIAVAAAAFSLAPAWLSYRYLENPIRFSPRFKGRSVLALAAVCIAVPVGASAALVGVNHMLLRSPAVASWQASRAMHADLTRGCNGPLDAQTLGRCVWQAEGARGRIALVGDSQAGQYTEPVVRAARRAGYDTTVLTLNSCPFAGVQASGTATPDEMCARFNAGTLTALTELRPSIVLLASRSDYYVGDPHVSLELTGGTRSTNESGAKAELWRRGLASVIAQLNAVGTHVVVIHPIPQLPAAPQGCAALTILLKACAGSVDRVSADRERGLAIAAEQRAVAGAVDATAFGFDDELCDVSLCSGAHAGTWTYRDVSHLTVAGSLLLTDRFARILEQAEATRSRVAVRR